MANGIMIVDTDEARNKAREMRNIATEIEDLLNDVSKKIDEINNVDTGIYQGNKRPAELKAELDDFRKLFDLVYGQVLKSADDIVNIANTMDQE
jgi:peptidoglycan hydrolase CwlO-like protein